MDEPFPSEQKSYNSSDEVAEILPTLTKEVAELRQQVGQMNAFMGALVAHHNYLAKLTESMRVGLRRFIPHSKLQFEFALAEHCNLHCRGCDHFSPIAEPKFTDFTSLTMDLARLSTLFDGVAERIYLLGGEPLLNPDIEKFLVMTRKSFPVARIEIVTNGVMLMKEPESFWNVCHDNGIMIAVTKYPVPLDFGAMEARAASYGVGYHYFNAGETVKTLYQHKLSATKTQDTWMSYLLCGAGNRCIYLQDGRLYPCTFAPTVRHFDKKFGTKVFNAEENSIDIYKAKSAQEILQFLAKPIPACAHCRVSETVTGIEWCRSKKTIDEWT